MLHHLSHFGRNSQTRVCVTNTAGKCYIKIKKIAVIFVAFTTNREGFQIPGVLSD
jgi:hypothetical protein